MGELADRIDTMRVRVSTPDGAMTAELHGRDELTLTFRPGWYELCGDADLERRLPRLASLLWAARTREYERIFGAVAGAAVTDADAPAGPRDLAWRRDRDELVARGRCADGRITVQATGMRRWEIHIAPGTVRTLTADAFAEAAGQAAGDLIRDQFTKIAALSLKHYGDDE